MGGGYGSHKSSGANAECRYQGAERGPITLRTVEVMHSRNLTGTVSFSLQGYLGEWGWRVANSCGSASVCFH